jgi:hypothetical protein
MPLGVMIPSVGKVAHSLTWANPCTSIRRLVNMSRLPRPCSLIHSRFNSPLQEVVGYETLKGAWFEMIQQTHTIKIGFKLACWARQIQDC